MYYITVENEAYQQPALPSGVAEGIVNGIYLVSEMPDRAQRHVQLFGSGAILRSALEAQRILAEQFQISSNVWSVTSYTQLRRDAADVARWNMLHPTETKRQAYLESVLDGHEGPFVAATDYVRAVPEQIDPWIPGGLFALGTDGMGRSETRGSLRRFFEVDAQFIALAAIHQLHQRGAMSAQAVSDAIARLDIDPDKGNPLFV